MQELAEGLGRGEGEWRALVAQDAVVGVELGETTQRLRGGQAGADPEGPEPDGAAPDEPDDEPAPDIAPARPRRTDEDGQRGKRRQRVVLVLEPRQGEDPDDGDQPDRDDRPPPRPGDRSGSRRARVKTLHGKAQRKLAMRKAGVELGTSSST